MHSIPGELKKNQPIRFVVVWIFSSLLVLGDISCWGDPLSVKAVPLNVHVGAQVVGPVGTLVYRGGVELTSKDPRFGGLSGLLVTQNGNRMLAISDRGWWLQGDLSYNQLGDFVGVQDVDILPMRPLEGPRSFTLDAEAVRGPAPPSARATGSPWCPGAWSARTTRCAARPAGRRATRGSESPGIP